MWVVRLLSQLVKLLGPRVQKSISKKLISLILLTSSIFALFATILQVGIEYQDDISTIEKHFSIIEKSYLQSIASSLKNHHDDLLKIQLEGLMNIPNVIYVSVQKEDTSLLSYGKKSEDSISKKFAIEHTLNNQKNDLGQLSVSVGLNEVHRRLIKRVLLIFLTLYIKTLAVAYIVFIIFQYLLIDHVLAIEKYLIHMSTTPNASPLTLNRVKNLNTAADEIDRLANSVNECRTRLLDSHSQLVQSAKLASMGEMVAGVNHELNNPLHIIKGFNGRIKAAYKKNGNVSFERVAPYIEAIDKSCERMNKIIQSFQNFSRQSAQSLEPIFINETVERSLALLEAQLQLRKISITKKLCQENPTILGDTHRLEQVFVNLLNNACDSFEEKNSKEKKISISTKVAANSVIVEIRDNGCGISKDSLEKIFNPFFTTKRVGKGNGLGLSISHKIISEHHGEITCESKEGVGTSFYISFKAHSS